jgi:aryl-alcohol dehydrogenase-like predicted oxidoreductase
LSKRPRTDYYIATKIGRYSSKNIEEWFDFSYERTLRSVENSIKLLNCDYIDLIQVCFILIISLKNFSMDFLEILIRSYPID